MNVYWSVLVTQEHEPAVPMIKFLEPKSESSLLPKINVKDNLPGTNFYPCPAFKQQIQNSFRLQFPFDYNLLFSNGNISSNMHDQTFFNTVLNIRSMPDKLLSFNLFYLFIAEESLNIDVTGCYFSDNDFVNKTMIVPGQFDIAKWVRPIDCAFIVKNNVDKIDIKTGDDFLNVKFLTDEKVTLKKFFPTKKLETLISHNVTARHYKSKMVEPLKYYYDLYRNAKMHKYIIKEVKDNLME